MSEANAVLVPNQPLKVSLLAETTLNLELLKRMALIGNLNYIFMTIALIFLYLLVDDCIYSKFS